MLALALVLIASLDGNTAFVEGKKLYDKFEYEQAVFRFEKVAVSPGLTNTDRATALVWLALSEAGVGDFDATRRAFEDACRADATVKLPLEVSAKLQKIFDEAKATAAKEAADAAKAASQAPPPPSVTAAPPPSSSPMPLVGGVGAATGGLLLAGGVGASVLFALSYSKATDHNQLAVDARQSLAEANLELTVATILVPAGALIGGAGAVLLFTAPPQ